ncbi:MAG: hypothetical protein KAJ44_04700 [Thermoplasmatales archaeon]|nr:hypothetical protein [Thermoplasmatales archaeon]
MIRGIGTSQKDTKAGVVADHSKMFDANGKLVNLILKEKKEKPIVKTSKKQKNVDLSEKYTRLEYCKDKTARQRLIDFLEKAEEIGLTVIPRDSSSNLKFRNRIVACCDTLRNCFSFKLNTESSLVKITNDGEAKQALEKLQKVVEKEKSKHS